MIKAIIFDYDGVIVDSFISVFEVYKTICTHFNVSCPETVGEFRKIYGYDYLECLTNLGIEESNLDEVNSIFSKEIVKKEHDFFDGILEIIKELSKKYKLYLVSSSYSDEIFPRMEKVGLVNAFEEIYCGADQNIKKSVMMADLLNKYKYSANEVISIGDRAIDYMASKKAGLTDTNIILANYGWGLDKNKIGNAKIAENPKEILSLIKTIDSSIQK